MGFKNIYIFVSHAQICIVYVGREVVLFQEAWSINGRGTCANVLLNYRLAGIFRNNVKVQLILIAIVYG